MFWAPFQAPQPGGLVLERALRTNWLSTQQAGFDYRKFTVLEGTKTPLSENAHKVSCTPWPGWKTNSDLIKAWARPICWNQSLWQKQGLGMAHCKDRNTGGSNSGEYSLAWASWRVLFSPQDLGPNQQPVDSSAGIPEVKPTEQEHSPTNQHTGCLKSFWAHSCPLNTPLDTALPPRWSRTRSTHKWAGTSLSHKKSVQAS